MSGAEKNVARLIKALASPSTVGMRHVWSILVPEERTAALQAWLTESDRDQKDLRERRQLLVSIVSSELSGFRPATVLAWPVSRLCAETARLPQLESKTVLAGVILQHHVPKLERIQPPLLDAIGANHDHGNIESVGHALMRVDKARLREGALRFWRNEQTPELALYLLSLFTMYPREWGALGEILLQVSRDLNEGPAGVNEHRGAQIVSATSANATYPQGSSPTTETGEWRAPARPLVASETATLSQLDHQLILRVVASVQGISDAPDERDLDDMLLEFVRLSATRHQSFFHVGLHDAMRRRPVVQDLPAENRSRTRWYLAGYISGLQRRSAQDEILNLLDNDEVVETLGDTGEGPSALAAPLVAGALIGADRSTDLLEFLGPASLQRNPQMSSHVLDYATRLAREERYEEALPLLELLWAALTEERGVSSVFRAKVSRRLAQCLREEDQLESARDLLLGLVESEDEEHKAMALADLGLISAGVRRLADLKLPVDAHEARSFVESMNAGWDRFTEAEALDVSTASHARYCKGMVALAKREYASAESLLESAITAFNRERTRYEPGGLLARAQFHLAVARCSNIESKPLRLERAAQTIAEALRDGEELPERFASEVIAGLSLRTDSATIAVMERLLESGGSELLDRLRDEEVAQDSVAVADAFASRVVAPNRTSGERAADCKTAYAMFILQRRFDEASRMVDQLEALAEGGVGTHELSSVLSNSERLSSIWEPQDIEEARVRFFERESNFGMAAHLLTEQFHRIVTSASGGAHLRAEDILERLSSYPNAGDVGVEELRRRLRGSSLEPEKLPASSTRAVSILVVGGNETQAQYDSQICLDYYDRAPWLDVKFMHTGWTSNWSSYVEEFERRHEHADAVVFIYLMRTELGRALRKRCTKPWRGCGGKGRASIQRAVDAAVAAALSA